MKKLGAILEEAGVIDEIQLVRALSHQRKYKSKLGKSLVELGFTTEEVIAKTVAKQLGLPYREFNPEETPTELLLLVPKKFAIEKSLFPVGYAPGATGPVAQIAISDPYEGEAIAELEKMTSTKMSPVISRDGLIADALRAWDRLVKTNKPSATEASATSSEPPPTMRKMQEGETFLESAEILDEEWQMDVSLAQSKTETPPAASKPTPPPLPKIDVETGADLHEIESVAHLGSVVEEDDLPEVEHTEAWEQAMPQGAPTSAPPSIEPEPINEEVIHSEPWESIMPGTDAAAEDDAAIPEIAGVPLDEQGNPEIDNDNGSPQMVSGPTPIKTTTPPPPPKIGATPIVATPPPPPMAKDRTPPPAPKIVKDKTPAPTKSPSPPPMKVKDKTPAPQKAPAPVTLDEISGELQTLKGQVGTLINEIRSLKDELKKGK